MSGPRPTCLPSRAALLSLAVVALCLFSGGCTTVSERPRSPVAETPATPMIVTPDAPESLPGDAMMARKTGGPGEGRFGARNAARGSGDGRGEPGGSVRAQDDITAHGSVDGFTPKKAPSSAGPVPVDASDATWGEADAPVTLVLFSDLECPFCARMDPAIEQAKRVYGPKRLRVVFKHFPLLFHKHARAAAEAGVVVTLLRGDSAFFEFMQAAYRELATGNDGTVTAALRGLNIDPSRVQTEIDSGAPARKVDADLALARRLEVNGTPASFVNGVRIAGMARFPALAKIIDEQLAKAAAETASGTAKSDVYAALAKQQYAPPAPPPGRAPPDTTTVWRVPIGKSPVRGPKTAAVTVVMFSEFQCPFCDKVRPTLEALQTKYGNDLRLVFKHNPLAFHDDAAPAAQLAVEAFARRGNKGFWSAYEKLFDSRSQLDSASLERIAGELGLNRRLTMQRITQNRNLPTIHDDQMLAFELEAGGTPHFFINGRRLAGAQDQAAFERIIDEEIARAAKLRKKGVAATRLYDALQKDAKAPPPPVEKSVPVTKGRLATKGPRNAKVTVHVYSDFECPYCARALPPLDALEDHLGKQVRFVFHHLPLPFHSRAMPAAVVAHEVLLQKGDAAFWKLHDLLFANRTNLEDARLLALAEQVGADRAKVEAALAGMTHQPLIEAQRKAAFDAGIKGTPSLIVGKYFVSGAKPYPHLRKLVQSQLR